MKKTAAHWASLSEALAVYGLIMAFIWRVREIWPRAWMLPLACILVSHYLRGEGAAELGFGSKEFKRCFRSLLPWLVNIGMGLWGFGVVFGTLRPSRPHYLFFGLLTYMAWGTFQQYLLNGYFTTRLRPWFVKDNETALAAALLFAGAHAPNPFLMAVTFLGGFVSARVYMRQHSLWALGIAHGLIGFLLLMTIPDSVSAHLLVGPKYVLQDL